MKLVDVVEAIRLLLWAEFITACGCVVLSKFLPFEVCFYLLCGSITALNGIGALQIEMKLKKEEDKASEQNKGR